jgi:hypothetical protein
MTIVGARASFNPSVFSPLPDTVGETDATIADVENAATAPTTQ